MYTPIQYVDPRTKQVTVRAMKWGLIPSYTGSHEKPNHFMRFNARSEGITETPAYRRLVDARRCVVHLDGFYEWKKPEKQPYYVYHGASSSSMRMAGIYDTWVDGATGDVLYTYSIVTAEAVGPFAAIHARFPVLLATADEANAWLSSDPFLVVQPLLAARPPTDLLWHAVTKQMGVPTFDGDECIQKLPTPPSITSFFAKSPAKSSTRQPPPSPRGPQPR
ncbi:hypothetical protein SPRG_07120 [Saprolegnia parasitica CBS 223.65]|uniref:Abasic site processing protein n=1 Tax=Saprolegnia parasitica (strain CBS 223.65) TaxID=695850 RepID=A0A067CLZ6_SAPPC|nr:hypothetical protein SPRG_07120 [Saprolegnia parasitica CBS 223.65]KDO27847.1 hypothetical protein SPRG_07120 [Saprolegnia parasitica CBS 223.65]|eukprot:XP_012201307.1 hypothetical protein SPRG_07120 [Saprolegnia parasitica CBS 223.65]